jgi:hypothetical protein
MEQPTELFCETEGREAGDTVRIIPFSSGNGQPEQFNIGGTLATGFIQLIKYQAGTGLLKIFDSAGKLRLRVMLSDQEGAWLGREATDLFEAPAGG